MTTKTIKTILFTSLIVAMILPFSGMHFADATISCDELIRQDNLKKIDKIDTELVKQLAKENPEYKKLESKGEINEMPIVFEGKLDMKDCTSEITDVTQSFTFVDKDNKAKKFAITYDAKDLTVKKTITKDDKKIKYTSLGAQVGNWAGYSVRDHSGASNVDGSLMYWNVPTSYDPAGIDCGTTGANQCHVAVWTGLTDNSDGSDVLSQLGTDSACIGNNCTSREYSAWMQYWDDGNQIADVDCYLAIPSAGDSMYGSMTYITSGTDRYYGYLANLDTSQTCSSYREETETPVFGQFISERPQIGGTNTVLAQFTDFTVTSYFYDSGVLQGADEIDSSGYDYHTDYIQSSSSPFAQPTTPTPSDTFTMDYIKSN